MKKTEADMIDFAKEVASLVSLSGFIVVMAFWIGAL